MLGRFPRGRDFHLTWFALVLHRFLDLPENRLIGGFVRLDVFEQA